VGLIGEKTRGQKSRVRVPLTNTLTDSLIFQLPCVDKFSISASDYNFSAVWDAVAQLVKATGRHQTEDAAVPAPPTVS
jgi:hypothetical protein